MRSRPAGVRPQASLSLTRAAAVQAVQEHVPCSICKDPRNNGGYLMQCARCERWDHPYCAGYEWPPDDDYFCTACGGAPPAGLGVTFDCAICMETKCDDARVTFPSCEHPDSPMCAACVFKHIYERASTCPQCRTETYTRWLPTA